jgi:hypothetical protein
MHQPRCGAEPDEYARVRQKHVRTLVSTLAAAMVTISCADFVSDASQVQVALPAQQELVALIHGVDDVAARVAPGLGDAAAGAKVTEALTTLQRALNAADGPGADKALSAARASVIAYRASSSQTADDPPELSAIDVALDRVDGQLRRLCTQTVASSRAPIMAPGVAARVVANQAQTCPK